MRALSREQGRPEERRYRVAVCGKVPRLAHSIHQTAFLLIEVNVVVENRLI